jgi:hypothetical protein
MNDDYQGKRPKQVKDSENTATFALICLIVSIIAAVITNLL